MRQIHGYITIPQAASMLRTTLWSIRRLFTEKVIDDVPKAGGMRLIDRAKFVEIHDQLCADGVIEPFDEIDQLRDPETASRASEILSCDVED